MKWNSSQRRKQLSEEIQKLSSKIKAREEEYYKIEQILNDYDAQLAEEQEAMRIIEEEIFPFFKEMKSFKNGGKKLLFNKPEILILRVYKFVTRHEVEEKRHAQYNIEAFDLPEMSSKTYTASELSPSNVWEKVEELAPNYNINVIPSDRKGEDYFATKL